MRDRSYYLLSQLVDTELNKHGITKTFASAYKNALFLGGIANPDLGYRHALDRIKNTENNVVFITDTKTESTVCIETVRLLVS